MSDVSLTERDICERCGVFPAMHKLRLCLRCTIEDTLEDSE